MPTLQNFCFQLQPSTAETPPTADLSFDLAFAAADLRANSPVELEVLLVHQKKAFNTTQASGSTQPLGVHVFELGDYRLEVRLSPEQQTNRELVSATPVSTRQSNHGAGTATLRLETSSASARLVTRETNNGHHMSSGSTPNTVLPAAREPLAPKHALFHFHQRLLPEGRPVLRFRRRIALPPSPAKASEGEAVLQVSEQLLVLHGADQLSELLGKRPPLSNRTFRLPELLTEQSAQDLVENVKRLWQTRRVENLRLEFWSSAATATVLWAALEYNDQRTLEPEIQVRLSVQAQGAAAAYANLLEAFYGNPNAEPVALTDLQLRVVWRNPAFAAFTPAHLQQDSLQCDLSEILEAVFLPAQHLREATRAGKLGEPFSAFLEVRDQTQPASYRLTVNPVGKNRPELLYWRFAPDAEADSLRRRLTATQSKLESTLESAPVGICITNEHGILETVNEAYCNIYGYAKEELMGQHFTKMVPADQHAIWKRTHESFIAGQNHTRGEFKVVDKTGRTLTILADSARAIGDDGRPRKITFVLDLTERLRTEELLRASEQRLMTVFETAPVGICITTPETEFEVVNEAYCNIYGYTAEELIGQSFTKIVPPEHAALWRQTHDKFLEGRTETRGEFTVRHKDGRDLVVLADSTRIQGADGRGRKVTFVLDITERKRTEAQAEQARREVEMAEQRLRQILQQAPLGICITRPDYTFETVNQAYCNIYGYHAEDLLGKPFTVVVPPSKQDWWRKKHDLFLDGQDETRGEFQVLDSRGRTLTILADSTRITGADGTPRKVTFVLDITERKQKEQELLASEERLMTLIESAPIGICVTGPDYRLRSVNQSYCDIYGYTTEELIGEPFTKVVPTAVKEHWAKTHDQFLAGQTHTRGEFEVVAKDGRRLIVLADSARITDASGTGLKVTFVLDITERKKKEEELAKSEERLMTLIESAPIGICVTGPDRTFRSVNDSYCAIYGYTPDELVGKSFTQIVPTNVAAHWEKTHDQFLAGQTHTRGEFEVVGKNGRKIIVMADSARITSSDGQPLKVTFVVDITERKASEQAILEANQALETTKGELETKNAELEANRIRLEESFAELEANKIQLETYTKELEENRKQLETSLQEIEQKNLELEANRKRLENSFAELERNKKTLEATNLELETKRQQLEDSLKEIGLKNAELEANRKQLETSYKKLETNNAELEKNRKEIEESYQQLEANNQELESNRKMLEESYTELEKNQEHLKSTNEKLERTLEELNSMQGQLVISEKMAALGQLIAGVAHEVNTPISAVKASVRNMVRDLPEALDGLPKLLAIMPKSQVGGLRDFLAAVISSDKHLTTKDERRYRRELETLLEGHDVEDAEEVANTLVEIRVVDEVEKHIPLFTSKQRANILEVAYKLGQLKVNLGNIDLASEKTSNIVKALKNYSYVQSSDRLVPSDLTQSVEDILTLMHNQTKYGIEIETNYEDDLPSVPIFPDELGQVWTNLITNSIQAMEGNGKLRIDIHRWKSTHIDVSITDNGPGIPKEIVDRIFEPFFTTKPQGEGTGLGLDISKKIIEKHQGEIILNTQPGETTFTVRIPIEPKVGKELLEEIPKTEVIA